MVEVPESNVKAIKVYFGTTEHPVSLAELKALTKEEREELGAGAKAELSKAT